MCDSVTYNNLLFKNYLNLSYAQINSPTTSRKYNTLLARAIAFFKENKELKKKNYSTFETDIESLSLLLSTTHSILSPAVTSNILAIVAGTLVLTEFVLLAPLLIFVFCLKITGITSIFIINYTYIYNIKYIKFTYKSILKKVIFIYNKIQLINIDTFQKPQLLKRISKKIQVRFNMKKFDENIKEMLTQEGLIDVVLEIGWNYLQSQKGDGLNE